MGGISQHVHGLSSFLKKEGNTVDIISSENTFTIPVKGLQNPSFMISAFVKSKLMKKHDIVHAHNLPSALAMKNTQGKKVLTIHGIYSEQVKLLHRKSTSKIAGFYEKDALKWADAITAVSKEAAAHYQNLGYKVHHIPNAINVSSLTAGKDRRYKRQVVYAGRLSTEKGIDSLIQIANKLDEDIHLLILGSGPQEEKIKKMDKRNIHFLGYQTKDKTISLIRGSDILIQPSLVEGISSTVLEAMACKTLVVATNIGGNKEIIHDKMTGILVDSNDTSEQILQTIHSFYSDKLDSSKIVDSAFDKVRELYDWSVVGKQYTQLYQSLLS